jgi:catechol 2,3-dioxygenase-like lactoylglutathione lyase family enzyme
MKAVDVFSGFSVNDSAKAKDFYTNTLGLELADETMGLHFKLPGGGTLFVYEKPDHQPATFTALNFVVEDIDAAVDELTGKGVTFERYTNMPGAQDDKGIMRSDDPKNGPSIAWFKDPAGNIVSVIQTDK